MKRGSALLIVLGMLSFIIVSAVAFSAYMRYARMPSSYLRRTSASRLLVKAALAEAISHLDSSIGNDRFPGFAGNVNKAYRRIDDKNAVNGVVDYWVDRFFIGTNRLISTSATVSTLCPEALAYIPPPLINEARYYSRRSIAGTWHSMGYDSGRFAFCAIDVSDFFDVNRVRANPSDANKNVLYGRNSSDDGRVTLAYVFENAAHTGDSPICSAEDWDDFMDNFLVAGEGGGNPVPLVSVADLNLTLWAKEYGMNPQMSPFCNYIWGNAPFVASQTDAAAELVRHMNFVTDSCYAMTNRVGGLDLSRATDQPFHGYSSLAGGKMSAKTVLSGSRNKFMQYLESPRSSFNNDPEIVQLCDYLDPGSVPATLALPTFERTPMIIGIDIDGNFALAVEPGAEVVKEATENGQKVKYYSKPYTLKLNGQLKVNAGTVYPFKYDRGEGKNYELQAAATVTLVPEGCDPTQYLRNNEARARTFVTCKDNWTDVEGSWPPLQEDRCAVTRCVSNKANVPYNRDPKDEQDAIANEDVGVQFPSFSGLALKSKLPETAVYPADMDCTFRTCVRKVRVVTKEDGATEEVPVEDFKDPSAPADRIGILPLSEDLGKIFEAKDVAGKSFKPTIQVWVRIAESGGETVDLVPACWQDDREPCQDLQEMRGSSQYPFLRFAASSAVTFDFDQGELTLAAPGAATLSPQAYMTDDPRFNYAPENFAALPEKSGEFKPLWWKAHSAAAANRDGDIFMATSDAGYLQSAYELTYLVATSRDGENNYCGAASGSGYNGRARTLTGDQFAGLAADKAMWRTYSQYNGGWAVNDIDRLDVVNGTRGFRVSPYTQSKEILMSALANTPLDWWAASTNMPAGQKVNPHTAANAQKYVFSERSTAQVKVKYANLEAIAENMKNGFRATDANADWRKTFDGFGWDGETSEDGEDSLCGVDLENNVRLHAVDRKFLHGFWKECFANRQQLFLVFVRAEPMMMGGGGLGQTPPQLGGRAVALVWRDPTETRTDVSGGNANQHRPHRTRVLFYRQFD